MDELLEGDVKVRNTQRSNYHLSTIFHTNQILLVHGLSAID